MRARRQVDRPRPQGPELQGDARHHVAQHAPRRDRRAVCRGRRGLRRRRQHPPEAGQGLRLDAHGVGRGGAGEHREAAQGAAGPGLEREGGLPVARGRQVDGQASQGEIHCLKKGRKEGFFYFFFLVLF